MKEGGPSAHGHVEGPGPGEGPGGGARGRGPGEGPGGGARGRGPGVGLLEACGPGLRLDVNRVETV